MTRPEDPPTQIGEARVLHFACIDADVRPMDAEWREVTDTWHQSADDAKRQAEFEYEGITSKWTEVSPL